MYIIVAGLQSAYKTLTNSMRRYNLINAQCDKGIHLKVLMLSTHIHKHTPTRRTLSHTHTDRQSMSFDIIHR